MTQRTLWIPTWVRMSLACTGLALMSCSQTQEPALQPKAVHASSPSHVTDGALITDGALGTIKNKADFFETTALLSSAEEVPCTLSGGTKTTCLKVTFGTAPKDYTAGPWCPTNIAADKTSGGIWIRNGELYDVDGDFISNLATFYKDDVWKLYDPSTGDINVTSSKESCAAAARPDVDAKYQNYCVECQPSYLDADVTRTYILPLTPVKADRPTSVGFDGIGVSLSGVHYDGPAPISQILNAHTLAPFDDCGGHVNLHVGYHIHASRGCGKTVSLEQEHAPIIGFALDGYALHAQVNSDGQEPTDLDQCRGHEYGATGYHYHVANAAKNQTLSCLIGETGCSSSDPTASCDASKALNNRGPGGQRGGPPPRGQGQGQGQEEGIPLHAFTDCVGNTLNTSCTAGPNTGVCLLDDKTQALYCDPSARPAP